MQTYLEVKGQKFWEIEVNGKSHTVRYGAVETNGQERTKAFESEEKALKDAEKLIASKKKKGYEEVEKPTPKEEVAEKEPSATEQKKNALIAHFWNARLKKFFKETLYSLEPNYAYKDRDAVFSLLKKLSLLDTPYMEKEIVKNKDNKIEKLHFLINGKKVLSFFAKLRNQSYPRFSFSVLDDGVWEYPYYKGKDSEESIKKFLQHFGAFYVENFAILQEEEKKWTDEYLDALLEKEALKKDKDNKIKDVAETNIDLIVQNLMKQAGYEYDLEETKSSMLLRVKVSENRFVELSLPHKTFLKRIEKVIPTIDIIKQNFYKNKEEYALLPFVLGSKPNGIKWGEIVEEEYMSSDFNSRGFKNHILGQYFKKYCEQTLLSGKKLNTDECRFLKEIAEWDFEHLTKEVLRDGYNKVEKIKIRYYYNDTPLFDIEENSFEIKFIKNCYLHFSSRKVGGVPAGKEWKLFLAGFVDFYTATLPIVEKETKEKHEEFKREVLAHKNLPEEVSSILKNADYEHIILLYGTGYYFGDMPQNTFLHGGVYVNMKTTKGRALFFQLEYKSYQEKVDQLLPSIELVEKTLKDSPLPFKFLSTKIGDYKWIKWKKG